MNLKRLLINMKTISFLLIILITMTAINKADAHIVTEEPWHPVAGAYLRAVFYVNLKPVDWELIASEYSEPIGEPGYDNKTVYEMIAGTDAYFKTNRAEEIRKAIVDKDSQALYESSTRALTQYISFHLAEASSKLDQPGEALNDVQQAKRLYRALENFIEQVDVPAYDQMGRSWLTLSTSVGSAGVLGVGVVEPDQAGFQKAAEFIVAYLQNNYENSELSDNGMLMPLPAKITANGNVNIADIDPWLPPGTNLNDQRPLPRLVLNFEARGQDEKDLFLVAYGDMLFDSPAIFGEPAKSFAIACSTCHNRSDINRNFNIPGISERAGSADVDGHFFNPRFNDHRNDSIDIPSLRGLRFTAPYGRDGRFASLRDFTRNVIVNEFGGKEPTPLMLDAIVTYMLEFDWLPSLYLEPDGRLNDRASVSAKRGEKIFNTEYEAMGGRACSTCHIPSANFLDGLRHDISSGDSTGPGARDSFFDTPTLINVKHTSPYFHDGSLETLGEVVEWFDTRYGLKLNENQKADLLAYLEAVGKGEDPYEVFDDENTVFLLDWGELSTFISTLDTLIPAQDKFHTELLIRTVSPDLRVDAIGLRDLGQAPMVYELADKLDEILEAVGAEDWEKSESVWAEYKLIEEKYSPQFK
jgi:mono/diheme cytochrome c family protein